jgi:hypothetical protein
MSGLCSGRSEIDTPDSHDLNPAVEADTQAAGAGHADERTLPSVRPLCEGFLYRRILPVVVDDVPDAAPEDDSEKGYRKHSLQRKRHFDPVAEEVRLLSSRIITLISIFVK